MKASHSRRLLEEGLTQLAAARQHLDYSFQQVASLPATLEEVSSAQLESTEAFTSRFARCVDLLVNKVLRSVDHVELLPAGSLLDVVNRAEKRGLIAPSEGLREMKEVRNMIAHDYAGGKAADIFVYCREQKPVFDAICDRVIAYAEKVLADRC